MLTPNGCLVGILTNRDVRFVEEADYDLPVSQFMTPQPLVTAPVGISLEEAKKLLQKHRIEKLPLLDEKNVSERAADGQGYPEERVISRMLPRMRRVACWWARRWAWALTWKSACRPLVEKDVDVVVVDTAHGHSAGVIRAIQRIHSICPDLPVIAGNVVTAEATEALIKAGAAAVKVGVGAGSICTTRVISGAGMPQLSAIYDCARAAHAHGCAGHRRRRHQVQRRYRQSHCRRGGYGHAGQPAGRVWTNPPARWCFSKAAASKNTAAWAAWAPCRATAKTATPAPRAGSGKLVPEGIEGRVPYKGNLHDYVFQLVGGLRSGMGYAGAATLDELRTKTQLVRITNAGLIESHPARCDHHQRSAQLPGRAGIRKILNDVKKQTTPKALCGILHKEIQIIIIQISL